MESLFFTPQSALDFLSEITNWNVKTGNLSVWWGSKLIHPLQPLSSLGGQDVLGKPQRTAVPSRLESSAERGQLCPLLPVGTLQCCGYRTYPWIFTWVLAAPLHLRLRRFSILGWDFSTRTVLFSLWLSQSSSYLLLKSASLPLTLARMSLCFLGTWMYLFLRSPDSGSYAGGELFPGFLQLGF